MPEKSGFFDSTADDIRAYPARDFAEYFAMFVTNGVFNGGTNLEVTAVGNDANIRLNLGYAWINGYVYSVFDNPIVLGIQPATTQDRIDRVILRLDTSTPVRLIKAIIVQGNPGVTPTPPALVRAGNTYDLSLAQIRVRANSTIIEPANITDERLNQTVCGLVNSLIRVDTATFQRQWDEFLQSIQDQGFATTSYVDNRVLTGGYGATTNSGNAYSVTPVPAPASLVEGLRVTIRINAANTGAATLNVKGLGAKSILKANGSAVASGNLKANSIYTLVYNGTAFILQGEGGEYGTAVAGDVRSTKNIGTDNGLVTGTLITRNTSQTNITPGPTTQTLQAGIYDYPIVVAGAQIVNYGTVDLSFPWQNWNTTLGVNFTTFATLPSRLNMIAFTTNMDATTSLPRTRINQALNGDLIGIALMDSANRAWRLFEISSIHYVFISSIQISAQAKTASVVYQISASASGPPGNALVNNSTMPTGFSFDNNVRLGVLTDTKGNNNARAEGNGKIIYV
ncbi:hypothetical protein JCM10914A_55680 [Paenibacillus sp. JCM 10914]|uniref:hypothetical protein n=1 Tax=Paenibacillus sp. JCM 10914 TaxID=1236974 RepID=UPI0003CCB980|nr:hypothetical protein [Paenibacillus sp. JCM 10914]GAE09630.1 hypothetical protein JCM10914_6000 [Paenibacillus sp. JCM 10914]